jgi:hypothetical protein
LLYACFDAHVLRRFNPLARGACRLGFASGFPRNRPTAGFEMGLKAGRAGLRPVCTNSPLTPPTSRIATATGRDRL